MVIVLFILERVNPWKIIKLSHHDHHREIKQTNNTKNITLK